MNLLYEQLYDIYISAKEDAGVGYDEKLIHQDLSWLPLDQATRRKLLDQISDYHLLWTTDAYATGLQTGVRLLSGPFTERTAQRLRDQ